MKLISRVCLRGTFFLLVLGNLAAQVPGPAWWYGEGRAAMVREDWYTAVEDFLECLRLNPAYSEAPGALAECYYGLGEFDESLTWVRKARALSRGSLELANLEAAILISLGRLDEAGGIIGGILSREPYNREALFTAAELDISRGRSGDAVLRYREAVRRFPDDRRLFISLALTLGSLGDWNGARTYIDRAWTQHPGDYQVNYYAAYLYAQGGLLKDAIDFAEQALTLREDYLPGLSLLSTLRYRGGQYEEACRLADRLITLNRENPLPWYLKGLCLERMGRYDEAIDVLSQAASIDGEDEFIRSTLEELLIAHRPPEDDARKRWAEWHFLKARDYRTASLIDQALFDYRQGLRLNPGARERREYADLLRVQGYPARYLEELRFLQKEGLGDKGVDDAVEAYDALLSGALYRRWGVDPVGAAKPHWGIAVFSLDSPQSFYHADAGPQASAYIRDILVHERNVLPLDLALRQPGFSAAFRAAREGGADYFLLVSVSEDERDLSLRGELFAARTGSKAGDFYAYRTGPDRLRYAGRSITDQLSKALPFRAELIGRRQGLGLMDKGRLDGVKKDDVYLLIRKRSGIVRNDAPGLVYGPSDVVGTFTVTEAGEDVSTGNLAREGFFDLVSLGDEIVRPEKGEGEGESRPLPAASLADPELRSLLRALRMNN